MVINLIILVVSCIALGFGATWLVDSAARIAKKFGISELVIGLTVVAFGTSAPEFAVTISGALGGNPDISVGNIVGSNIFNIGFILGGCVLVHMMQTGKTLVKRDGLFLIVITGLLIAFLYNGHLSRVEGAILFASLVGYLYFLFMKKEPISEDDDLKVVPATWKDIPLFVVGLVMIVGGGHFLVQSAEAIAEAMGMSEWVIAITVVAAGTSVPELVISLVAIIKKHHGISAGNLIGSNLFNTLGVLGLAGVISPLQVAQSAMFSLYALLGLTALVVIFMRTGWRLVRLEGLIIVLVSLAIWISNIVFVKPV